AFAARVVVLPPVGASARGAVRAACFKLFHGDLGASLARVATIAAIGIGGGLVAALIAGILLAAGLSSHSSATVFIAATVSSVIALGVQAVLGVLLGPLQVLTYADMRARLEPTTTGTLVGDLNQ